MSTGESRRLVIDACVARAAGDTAEGGSPCREFLTSVLTICHRVVLNHELRAEWDHVGGRFARSWLVAMQSKSKVVSVARDPASDAIWQKIGNSLGQNQRVVAKKDFCLVEAAIETDGVIVSLERKARTAFGKAAAAVPELRTIVWVDPAAEDETPIQWLQEGANREPARFIGQAPRSR